jgi:hypothetical protein
MAENTDKKLTAEEWMKRLGTNPAQYGKKLTKEEYERTLKAQNTIKNLLGTGRNLLQGIAQTVRPGVKELAKRLDANYDTAVGKPMFGTSIREILYPAQLPRQPSQFQYQQYPFGYPGSAGPQYPYEYMTMPFGGEMMPLNAYQLGQQQQQQQQSQEEPQVIFLYDDKTSTVSEVIEEVPSRAEAESEIMKLKKQGLPAAYASKETFIGKKRLKA